jgi:hypothetical protein
VASLHFYINLIKGLYILLFLLKHAKTHKQRNPKKKNGAAEKQGSRKRRNVKAPNQNDKDQSKHPGSSEEKTALGEVKKNFTAWKDDPARP